MPYVLPTNTDYVSCSWQCHRDRPTPSSEPGTDYACGYGSPIYAPGNGTVVDVNHSNGGGTGRYCAIDMDDGRRTRALHMSEIWVSNGQRVSAGQQIGLSGASGYGDDWYYGPHLHQTLWDGHYYSFCSSCTIDFAPFVGPAVLAPNQRQVGANSANGRGDPSTANPPVGDALAPWTVGNFDGWAYGENVSGNNLWYRGTSGRWFWSGGFTEVSSHDLTDLNAPVALEPHQRKALTYVNGRQEPNTTSAVIASLDVGAIGNFDGWINGQSVEGEIRWLRGVESRAFYSLKYLDPQNVDGLTDLNTPVASDERTNGENDTNVRGGPFTTFSVIDSIAPGEVVEMSGWAHGESVQSIDVWFRIAADNNWAWSGGFTSQATDGLDQILTLPTPPNANNPRGLPEYLPVNPAAVIGLEAPLGYNEDGSPASRALCGDDDVSPVIDRAIIHHTGTTADQLDYFSYKNDRSSCPTWYVRPSGERIELIRPGHKPASTGPDWNCRSVAWEVLNETGDPTWLIPELARRAVAEDIAWLREFDGGELDGVPVSFKIDAEHVIGHNTALPGATICPGPDMDVPGIIAMAQAIWDEKHPPIDPECPECPECPDPGDTVDVPVSLLEEWRDDAMETYGQIEEVLEPEGTRR